MRPFLLVLFVATVAAQPKSTGFNVISPAQEAADGAEAASKLEAALTLALSLDPYLARILAELTPQAGVLFPVKGRVFSG